MSALAVSEATRLASLEATIEQGLQTFVEVGQALAEIRDSGLYKTYGTFEDYCRERWDMSRGYAKRLVMAAETVALMTVPIGTVPPPASESIARELAPLRDQPEKLKAAWSEAVEINGDKPTAAAVREVVAQYRDEPPPQPEPQYAACPTCGQRVRADRPLNGRGSDE
ncbi:MAG: hypothetical protein H0W81_06425 [Chloroflexi bacterium]|nr:hypothetical protein [Chloroflexota bacterium]